MSCGVGCRHSWDPELLSIQPPAWKLPCATGETLKNKAKKKNKKKKKIGYISCIVQDTVAFFFFLILRLHPLHIKVPRLGVQSEL